MDEEGTYTIADDDDPDEPENIEDFGFWWYFSLASIFFLIVALLALAIQLAHYLWRGPNGT